MKDVILILAICAVLAGGTYLLFFRGAPEAEPQSGGETASQGQDAGETAPQAGTGESKPVVVQVEEQTDGEIEAICAEAAALSQRGELLKSRNAYSNALNLIVLQGRHVANREVFLRDLREKLQALNASIYTPTGRYLEEYEVDGYLSTIARKFDVPYQYIARLNNISNPNHISRGRILKVVRGPFNVVVDLSERRLYVFLGDYYYCDYEVSVGKPGSETPVGTYMVVDKMDDKMVSFSWTNPDTGEVLRPGDPEFMLGTRWIKLSGGMGIGIHGRNPANDDDPLGEAVSHGCVRMRNREVEELYDMLAPDKSQVKVQP
jgi:hypothetical protein